MRRVWGFTLLEMMVVVLILGTLLLVPATLTGFGARSRLESSANTMAAFLGHARSQAILDGYETRVQIGSFKDEVGTHQGFRMFFTNLPPVASGASAEDPDRTRETREMRTRQREWLSTGWHPLEDGIVIAGVSEELQKWQKVREQEPFEVVFMPDGTVGKAFGLRLESKDLEVKRELRTMTIVMNGLTAEASVEDGDAELPPKRDAREFN